MNSAAVQLELHSVRQPLSLLSAPVPTQKFLRTVTIRRSIEMQKKQDPYIACTRIHVDHWRTYQFCRHILHYTKGLVVS